MPDISKLLSGYRVFKNTTFTEVKEVMNHGIKEGIIKPSTLIVTSSGLQISPDKILGCNPGDLFVVRNLGGLIPAHDAKDSTNAVIEYALYYLNIENIIVLGHSYCDSVTKMLKENYNEILENENISYWLNMTKSSRDLVINELSDLEENKKERIYEQEIISKSVKNLIEYPEVKKMMKKNKLLVFGWYFDILSGDLMALDPETGYFEPLV